MAVDRVKFQEIVSSQLPRYVREDFPLLVEFLEQYYVSQEYESGPIDIINNIDQYVKVEQLTNLVDSTNLNQDLSISSFENQIVVDSTVGFPENNGIIKIDNEIIFYERRKETLFENCTRGFSGITTYVTTGKPNELTFSESEVDTHSNGAVVENLNILFLKQFLIKLKKQFTPGFSERSFFSGVNAQNFIYNAKSFYSSKGSNQSYEILFRALYGEDVEVILPSRFLFTPSNADYRVTKDYIVERLQGNPLDLKNLTIFQKGTNARGSVSNVQQIPYENFQFFQISIDSGTSRDSDVNGSIFGEFRANPLTKVLDTVSIGASIINVDSTIDFPEFGDLIVRDIDDDQVSIAYSGKTINQFFNVTGVTNTINKKTDIKLDSYSFAYVGIDTTQEIRVRFTSSLKDFVQKDPTRYFRKDDTIEIKSLGYEAPGKKNNDYVLNIKTKYKIATTEVIDGDGNIYKFTFSDKIFFKEGYKVRYENFDQSVSIEGTVTRITSANTINVQFSTQIPLTGEFFIENQLLKGNSSKYPYINNFVANVQNTYSRFDQSLVIASNSLPRYDNVETNTYDKKITFSASLLSTDTLRLPTNPTTLPDHGFYTGDAVYYESNGNGFQGISSGSYFVFRVDKDNIKLARSKSNLGKEIYIIFNGSVVNASISLLENFDKTIEPQGFYRSVLDPLNRSESIETRFGYTGIFVNGLELLNYKSSNSVYYGNIRNLTMADGGLGYDVINPPVLNIKDSLGVGATGVCNVRGVLQRIDVTDPGRYYDVPSIKISGGNGRGAIALPRVSSSRRTNTFIANSPAVDISDNTIQFSEDHRFFDGEGVIYEPQGNKIISGLSTNAEYYVFVKTPDKITLHRSENDALLGESPIALIEQGKGLQQFTSVDLKINVSSILVVNSGIDYENKKRTIPFTGVNTASNQVEIVNHGFETKDRVQYTLGSPRIDGLSENTDYYVVKINDNAFSLTEVGVGTIREDFYFDRNILIDFTNPGNGSFNYPPITVEIQGNPVIFDKVNTTDIDTVIVIESPITNNTVIAARTLAFTQNQAKILTNPLFPIDYFVEVEKTGVYLISDANFLSDTIVYGAKIEPVFRGYIDSIDITDGGVGYGSSTIIDFVRQPEITFESGKGAKIVPIINDGKIVEVIVTTPGSGYNCQPDIQIVSETGKFAQLVPIVKNGVIDSVVVQSGGVDFVSGKTFLNVISPAVGANAIANINSWNVNLFEKNFANILEDDCVLQSNIKNTSLQFSSLYAPRPLRSSINVVSGFNKDNVKYGIFDITLNNSGEEVDNVFHSPILGWAYDGNPIYGPYGFSNVDGTGTVRRMRSGYKLLNTPINRPSYDTFPNGFFVDDFIFSGDGDLDESNGRFCVTPDYPNGVYAYFCTISDTIDNSGPFNKYRRPVFPYVIGNKFRSIPNRYNFVGTSNQTDYDITQDGLFRNTSYYFTNGGNAGYDYIFNSDLIINQTLDVTSTTSGSVDELTIIDGGDNYAVGDNVILDSRGTGGRNAKFAVSNIKGKSVTNVSLAKTFFEDVEFTSSTNENIFIGITSTPHDFLPNDVVSINNITPYYKGFNGSYNVGISSNKLFLSVGLSTNTTTGIVTYISLGGQFIGNINPNDILKIEDERVKVLNVDNESSRIRVLREVDSTIGVAHSSGTVVQSDSRLFSFISSGIDTTKNLTVNRQFYFEPNEALGIGTNSVGSATTITFANPGSGTTQIILGQQQVFITNHNLSLNTPLIYYTNGGSSIPVWSGIDNTPVYNLEETRNLFAVPLTKDIIGISSQRVGVNSEGKFVGVNSEAGGLLYFDSKVGLGSYHSFNTNINNVLKGLVSKNIVTVSTGQTHGLKRNDSVNIDVNPTTTTTIKVTYDDFNRRIVFDSDTIEPEDVNTGENTFKVPSNKYNSGDKIIYSSSDPSLNLTASSMYYVFKNTQDTIKIVKNKYELSNENPNFINIGSATTAIISRINPGVFVQKNQNIKFDLSDPSLSFSSGPLRFSAFDMFIYSDIKKQNKFYTTETTRNFEVTKSGKVGIDSTAFLNIKISNNIPEVLYYGFEPDNIDLIPSVKLDIYEDTDVPDNNTLNLVRNKFDGSYAIVGVTSDTFTYNIPFDSDDVVSYGSSDSNVTYITNSSNAIGPINTLSTIDRGIGYLTLPDYFKVDSKKGTGAILEPTSNSIGNIIGTRFNNIGFGYPSDRTLNAVANLPQILLATPLGKFESIGISSAGVNYSQPADLIVIDGLSGEQLDVELRYELEDSQVEIVRNTNSINAVPPIFIPTNNTNGFNVNSVTYNDNTKIVRIVFTNQFSEEKDWPFKVGEKVLVENIAVGFSTTGKGYNSEDYGYALFEVTSLDSQIGGAGAYIEYDLTEYLGPNEFPGDTTSLFAGSVTPQSFFPIFDPNVIVSDFFKNEKVVNPGGVGIVERFDPYTRFLYIQSEDDFEVGTIITSDTSGNQAIIESRLDFDATINLGVGVTVIDGWQTNSGFLNDNLQVIPNNEYYQNFSYSLKSRVPFDTWSDSVSALNHIAGFQKFADLVIDNDAVGIVSAIGVEVETVIDLIGVESLYCFPDFDGGTERTIDISNNKVVSTEIVFENKILLDYFESRGNRVLNIDDFSGEFNSNPRETRYSIIDFFDNKYTWNKIFTLIQDTEIRNRKQFGIVTLLQDGTIGYSNQYGTLDTGKSLGSFDYIGAGTSQWGLTFFPNLFEFNNYEVSYFSFSGIESVLEVGSKDIGDIISIGSSSVSVPVSTETTLIQIPTSKRSAKLHVQLEKGDNEYFYTELNLLHDGTDVELLQYGSIDSTPGISEGFGTYDAEISGGNVNVKITPTVGTALTANILSIETDATATGVGTTSLVTTNLSSYYKQISASATPVSHEIASYGDPFACEYFMVTVHDTTNDEYEVFECHVLDSNNLGIVKYGSIISYVGLGTIGVSKSSETVSLVYTPNEDIAVDVRVFGISLKNFDNITGISSISDLNNNILFSDYGTYTGTEFDKKRSFTLKNNDNPIFQRSFLGNSSTIVDITNNQVTIPNHFFVTGEKVEYSYENSNVSTLNAINITSTDIGGITTDKLPTELYVVKFSNTKVGFAQSAFDALSSSPTLLDFTSVGIGTFHKITATNQNAKALVAIDNIIQAPVTETKVTTKLDEDIIFDTDFEVVGIQSFKANDIIKIDSEFMLIQDIGVGQTNSFRVLRGQLGSGVATHGVGTTVNLMGGNYNITDNIINFVEAPFGSTPIGTTTGNPDERDFTGLSTNSTFQGRTFIRSGIENADYDTYSTNYTFDNIQSQFNGQKKSFSLLNGGNNVIGFSTQQAIILNSNILQEPQGAQATTGDFRLEETAGVTSITYLGDFSSSEDDPNKADIPRGGTIISIGSSKGFGYQPLIAAGATCTVSAAGTILSVAIGNSGSGYRVGVQTVNVGYAVSSVGLSTVVNIGTATVQNGSIVAITTSYEGVNLDQNNPPLIVIDKPLPYGGIPLVYADGSNGIGTGARVDVTVGQGSSVINFEIISGGFGYGNGETLRLAIGGTTGIQTTGSSDFAHFEINVTDVYRDTFNGFTIGELDVFDKLDDEFDGKTTKFPLKIANSQFAIEVEKGSEIDITQTLIVTINDILQVPNDAYKFNGGSIIEFTEPPKKGDTSKIIFYKGTPDVDVTFVDILETVKIGDTLQLKNDAIRGQDFGLQQEQRIVTGITTLDTTTTFPYDGPGLSTDLALVRPITWCKQTDDISIDGKFVTKDRVSQEPSIFPAAYLTSYIGVSSNYAYTDTARPFFDSRRETNLLEYQDLVTITDQSSIRTAIATAVISGGSVISLPISDPGEGYTSLNSPNISISAPNTLGGETATAEVYTDGDIVSFINITNPGTGYTQPPNVLIEQPSVKRETISISSYFGDQGTIVGYALSTNGLTTFELYIPEDSFMRDTDVVGTAVTISQLSTDDIFVVNLSNIGVNTISNFDGIYKVTSAYNQTRDLTSIGLGVTTIRRVEFTHASIGATNFSSTEISFDSTTETFDSNPGLVGGDGVFQNNTFYGNYTWGKLEFLNRVVVNAEEFTPSSYEELTSSPLIQRTNPLKFNNYTS